MKNPIVYVLLVAFMALTCSNAFTVISVSTRKHQQQVQVQVLVEPSTTTRTTATQLYGWMDAFKNDESLGPRENAGLKNGPQYNEQVTVNGKSVSGAVVGQKLTQVAMKARVKIPVNCQKGDCGTCMVNFNGRKVKACQTGLPAGKSVIQTL